MLFLFINKFSIAEKLTSIGTEIDMEKLNILKKVLRALLISEDIGKGMPLRLVESKYREYEGRSIPLFGYPDTAALMNSLTDTVYMVIATNNN